MSQASKPAGTIRISKDGRFIVIMVLHAYECEKGHLTEQAVEWDTDSIRCPKCRRKAERLWSKPGSRHWTDQPIVLFKLKDGSYSFPGDTSARTPAGAERIEMRSMAEYNRTMRQVNQRLDAEERQREEGIHAGRERYLAQGRADLVAQMGQTSDPYAKDLMRHALSQYETSQRGRSRAQVYSEAMEYRRSNWEKD